MIIAKNILIISDVIITFRENGNLDNILDKPTMISICVISRTSPKGIHSREPSVNNIRNLYHPKNNVKQSKNGLYIVVSCLFTVLKSCYLSFFK